MLERVPLLKPRIEHPVREDAVGLADFSQHLPCREAVELPDAVHDEHIEILGVRAQPWDQLRRVSIAQVGRSHRMNRQWKIPDPRSIGRIEADDFDLAGKPGRDTAQLPDPLDRPTPGRVRGMNDVGDSHLKAGSTI